MFKINKVFASNLRFLRKNSGFTQAELAKRMDVRLMTISRWENGGIWPEGKHIQKLAELFSVPYARFFEDPAYIKNKIDISELGALSLEEIIKILSEHKTKYHPSTTNKKTDKT